MRAVALGTLLQLTMALLISTSPQFVFSFPSMSTPSVSTSLHQSPSLFSHHRTETFSRQVESTVSTIGNFLLLHLFGLQAVPYRLTSDTASTSHDHVEQAAGLGFDTGGDGAGLTAWSESTVFVERTNSLHPSRPSSFGPHLSDPLQSLLFPIEAFVISTNETDQEKESLRRRACDLTSIDRNATPAYPWIALIERGKCPFSNKVRTAQQLGAVGVIFGDMSLDEGGLGGIGELLTPWSPDDTSDVRIPSSFVSRASYVSILKTWNEEQSLDPNHLNPAPVIHPSSHPEELKGLVVIMSRDEVFIWPLFDLLLVLLFLPSLLTLLTVFTQRIRAMRQRKLDRAPADVVARLPVFVWGGEKPASSPPSRSSSPPPSAPQKPTEHTPLLSSASDPFSSQATASTSYLSDVPVVSPPRAQSSHASWLTRSSTRVLGFVPFRTFGRGRSLNSNNNNSNRDLEQQQPYRPRKTRTFAGSGSLTECAICLSEFEKGDTVMQLPCGHIYHKDEIEGWLTKTKRVCPVCRASITPDLETPSSPPQSPSLDITLDPQTAASNSSLV